ncbi:ABC transporter ATP-binding protein [Treponema lecithinolyticum]|uniref:ABC transporter, ATP-binding protein n=1 Tax=Treponema lecithinolyticum ATCC 700332 TaxID=1321815 RepID=A0ABN0NXW5_TRELE|nr:ATP-binding cassette domain-containing protein [Treponema lecithinolyticum]ERJ92319.1 ABC transporter, ATP-binding protein [Treponema lecithinolyticum ATCC 700332]
MAFIRATNLTKIYKRKKYHKSFFEAVKSVFTLDASSDIIALNDISFSIEKGEKVAYLGVNGSGKSTTIKILSGILFPTTGEVIIDGIVPYKKRIIHTAKIGTVFGQRSPLYWDLPVMDTLYMLKSVYELSDEQFNKSLKRLSQIADMENVLRIPVRQLSLGQRMTATLVCSLIHNPKLLFLDEPTIGLDVFAKENMRIIINRLHDEFNTTVFLSSHDLDDIEKICNRVIVIHAGQIIYDGAISRLKQLFSKTKKLYVTLQDYKIKFENFDVPYRQSAEMYEFDVKDYEEAYALLEKIRHGGAVIEKFNVQETEFADIVKQLLKT